MSNPGQRMYRLTSGQWFILTGKCHTGADGTSLLGAVPFRKWNLRHRLIRRRYRTWCTDQFGATGDVYRTHSVKLLGARLAEHDIEIQTLREVIGLSGVSGGVVKKDASGAGHRSDPGETGPSYAEGEAS